MLLYPHQKKTARSKARFTVERWGRRSGKTILKRERMLFKGTSKKVKLAREFKYRSVIFIAPTQKQARTIVWESFKQRLKGQGDYNESRLEIKIPNELGGETTIFIGGWENRENYRGMSNVIHIEFDETDTMKNFFIGWQEIFRPMLIETGGSAGFGGTPKKENPNLRRLEKMYAEDKEWEFFHFTSQDNPAIPPDELTKAQKELDANTYRQEILGEYVDNIGALFRYDSLLDIFTNTVTKQGDKYMTVDIADDGTDKTIFALWEDLECYRIERYERLNTENIINKIREIAAAERIPFSGIAVDAIGVGAGVASSSMLDGIVGYKSSYQAIRTDASPVLLPNVHYTKEAPLVTDYKNLRSQCVFTLAEKVNNHLLACTVKDGIIQEQIIEELSLYQDASKGDGKRFATPKEDVKDLLGRSPDISDTFLMRMYFDVKNSMIPKQSFDTTRLVEELNRQFDITESKKIQDSSR